MAKKKGLTISKARGGLYDAAKALGDIQAIASGDPKKIAKRVGRRAAGKVTGQFLGKLFK